MFDKILFYLIHILAEIYTEYTLLIFKNESDHQRGIRRFGQLFMSKLFI